MKNYFAKNLLHLRKKSGKSQTDIGLQLNKAHTSIGNWEKEISEPNFSEIEKIASFFEILPADLMFTDLSKGNLIKNDEAQKNDQKGNLKGNVMGNLNAKKYKNSEEEGDTGSYLINEPAVQMQIQKMEGLYQSQISTLNNLLSAKDTIIAQLSADNERLKRDIEAYESAMASQAKLIKSLQAAGSVHK